MQNCVVLLLYDFWNSRVIQNLSCIHISIVAFIYNLIHNTVPDPSHRSVWWTLFTYNGICRSCHISFFFFFLHLSKGTDTSVSALLSDLYELYVKHGIFYLCWTPLVSLSSFVLVHLPSVVWNYVCSSVFPRKNVHPSQGKDSVFANPFCYNC